MISIKLQSQAQMSIVVKSDELNLLIYKYLCEANLSHTAYTIFNEAQLQAVVSQYKFDMKPGQLISTLEKGLIFNQIESHVTISEYEQCNQPFYLIKPHTCKITQKIKETNEKFLDELNEQIYASMRRTSSVHNTLEPNKDYEEIIYQQKSSNYLDKLAYTIHGIQNVQFGGNQDLMYAHDPQSYTISLIKRHPNYLGLQGILPCIVENTTKNPVIILLLDDSLIRIYDNNICQITIIKFSQETKGFTFENRALFQVPLTEQCKQIKVNPKIKGLLVFLSDEEFCLININKEMCVLNGKHFCEWKSASQYFILDPLRNLIILKSLIDTEFEKCFNAGSCKVNKLSISQSEIYFMAQSKTSNRLNVYTFDKPEALYIFNFGTQMNGCRKMEGQIHGQEKDSESQEEIETLEQSSWISNNGADDLLILTNKSIRTFGIELNNYLKIIDIHKYDQSVKELGIINKDQGQTLAICLGFESIIVYDVAQGKIQRILYQRSDMAIDRVYQFEDKNYIGLKINSNFYLAKDKDFDALFI